MREVTKAEMLEYYEQRLLEDILVLPDRIVAIKVGHSEAGEPEGDEAVWCPLA